MTPAPSQGQHWLLDLSDCACPAPLLRDADQLRRACVSACQVAGMQVVGDRFHQFQPAGVTGVVLLAESHLAVHTRPEIAFVALDIYVCDHSQQNTSKGAALKSAMRELFAAATVSARCLPRSSVAVA